MTVSWSCLCFVAGLAAPLASLRVVVQPHVRLRASHVVRMAVRGGDPAQRASRRDLLASAAFSAVAAFSIATPSAALAHPGGGQTAAPTAFDTAVELGALGATRPYSVVASRELVALAARDAVATLVGAETIWLGEHRESSRGSSLQSDQEMQAGIIAAVAVAKAAASDDARPPCVGVGLEAVRAEYQPALDAFSANRVPFDLDALAAATDWDAHWPYPIRSYGSVLELCYGLQLPIVALGASSAEIDAIRREGLAALDADAWRRLDLPEGAATLATFSTTRAFRAYATDVVSPAVGRAVGMRSTASSSSSSSTARAAAAAAGQGLAPTAAAPTAYSAARGAGLAAPPASFATASSASASRAPRVASSTSNNGGTASSDAVPTSSSSSSSSTPAAASFANHYCGRMVWDESMAARAAEWVEARADQDPTLVVLAGAEHVVFGCGAPARCARRLTRRGDPGDAGRAPSRTVLLNPRPDDFVALPSQSGGALTLGINFAATDDLDDQRSAFEMSQIDDPAAKDLPVADLVWFSPWTDQLV